MHLQVFTEDPGVAALALHAVVHLQAKSVFSADRQDFSSTLYRNPGRLGLYGPAGLSEGRHSLEAWRAADVTNLIAVMLPASAADHTAFSEILNAGADDAQPATIHPAELGARLLALSVRERALEDRVVEFCGVKFDTAAGYMSGANGTLSLSKSETAFMAILMKRKGNVVTREMIYELMYEGDDRVSPKIIDVYVSKLRAKLFHVLGGRDVVVTARGHGYRFERNGFSPSFSDGGVFNGNRGPKRQGQAG